jgi:hypothetical protein
MHIETCYNWDPENNSKPVKVVAKFRVFFEEAVEHVNKRDLQKQEEGQEGNQLFDYAEHEEFVQHG